MSLWRRLVVPAVPVVPVAVAIAAALLAAAPAHAQQIPPPPPAAPEAPPPGAVAAPASCLRKDRPVAAPSTIGPAPVTWSDFEIEGELRDPPATVRTLFSAVMTRRSSLTEEARADLVATATRFGYHLVALTTRDTPKGSHAVVRLAPLPLVRRVIIDIKQSLFATLLDDQIRRRMRIRTGTYLSWSPAERRCELDDEQAHIADYLHFDEGFFDATVKHREAWRGDGVEVTIEVALGSEYNTGNVQVTNPETLPAGVDAGDVVQQFQHRTCVLWVCFGASRFTRARHTEDVQRVVRMFHNLGYPEVRVHTSFERNPAGAFNRNTRAVDFTVTVDPRRRLDIVFEGHDPDSVSDTELRDQLTFNAAASSDDVEASDSARALVGYLQNRGWFDAHVTWTRERHQSPAFDRIRFFIDQGRHRPVRAIQFTGNRAFTQDQLENVIGTTQEKLSTSLFGGNTSATSAQLDADVDSITQEYRRAGYRDARVRVEAATDPSAFGSAAMIAALAAADRGDGLYVRYAIDEGEPTLLSRIEVVVAGGDGLLHTDADRALCQTVLADLADMHGATLAPPQGSDRCVATVTGRDGKDLNFREAAAAQTKDDLKDRLFSHGRPRAEVGYEAIVIGPRRVAARYTLANIQTLQIGAVVIRGNFKTRASVILGELNLRRGALFTQEALADGARRLRNTSLFDAVNVSMPDLETTTAGEVNAVVDVVERNDFLAQLDTELGYSTYNGMFLKLIPSFKNLFGLGISFDIAGTIGFDLARYLSTNETRLRQLSAEATLRMPRWLSRRISPIEFETELTAFHRRVDSPRFGPVTTDGATVTLSRTWERKRIGTRDARAITTGLSYDFRLRERPIDVLRPVGADDDQTQVPISTRTGSVGLRFEWEQRVDRQHVLSPLAPEDGFRFEAQVSFASEYFGGQDTFLKLSTAGSRYWSTETGALVVRADLRYDQGFPLGDAVLLPEVERFFAGGDATVRGYDDDRLATEIVRVGVPPLDNIEQIRILPAGGNIRLMSSLDAQLRIYKILATAVFADAGLIANQWSTVTTDNIRPSVGVALVRVVFPFGAFAFERAVPLRPQLGDDPRGRWHISFAARAQF